MDWMSVWRHLAGAFILTVSRVDEGESECPESYWEEPSRRCSYPLVSSLEQLHPTESLWNLDQSIANRTCTSWRNLSSCYHQLQRLCAADRIAVQEISMYMNRYRLFSLTCTASHAGWKDRRRLIDCFLPHIRPTRICSEAFDSHFRSFVSERQHRNACRVVSTAMKCFEEIRNEIAQSCDDLAADDFQRSYIQPLVEQTRDTVLSKIKCELSAPYEHYFNDASSPPSERSGVHVFALVVAFVVARRRYSL